MIFPTWFFKNKVQMDTALLITIKITKQNYLCMYFKNCVRFSFLFYTRMRKRILHTQTRGHYIKADVHICGKIITEMVFCYQNCSGQLWEKKCSSDWEKLLKFETEGRELAKILGSLEQYIWTVKGQNNFWNRMIF